MVPRRWSEEFLVNQDSRVVFQRRCSTKSSTVHRSAVKPKDHRAGFFLEAHVSEGIAGITLPAPPARLSTSEILMPLLLRP